GHLQNTVALAVEGEAFASQHVGDLDTEPARAFQAEVASGLEAFLAVEARVLAVDLHPDYASTWLGERLAAQRGGRLLRVQHHLAHAAATLGEHGAWPGEHERVGALVLDGTGFGAPSELAGDDLRAAAWGAEWLELDGALRWRRAATSRALPLVGGERAVREPWRIVAAALALAGDGDALARLPLADRVPRTTLAEIARLARGPGFPRAHGAGRLFEAAGALVGACVHNTYEGEAAARFEALASRAPDATAWDEVRLAAHERELPSVELLSALARRVLGGEDPATAAAGFHATFCELAASLARRAFEPSTELVALGGGCLVNRLLARGLVDALTRAGYRVLLPRELPAGDGGLAYGQCVVASAALAHSRLPNRIGA
ncbi:MAG: carbamoyltransferase HypF, partial [Planctomycetes bacterium]|nr:carbamoyltransferase HypF [Planctomycetota bacterium]